MEARVIADLDNTSAEKTVGKMRSAPTVPVFHGFPEKIENYS
jgi:hypothetical protein